MDTKKLDLFCALYKDDIILDKLSLIDIMIDLQVKTKDLQSLIWNAFPGFPDGSKENDDLIYKTISDLVYDKGADIKYIDKWLNEFEISIDDIFNNNLGSNEIGKYISVKHIDFKGTSENKQKAHLIQVEFLDFFCKFYADKILPSTYFSSEYRNKNEWERIKLVGIDDEYLNSFCEAISKKNLNKNISFTNNYELVNNLVDKLKIEIIDNILNITDNKVESYLDRIMIAFVEIQNTINFSKDSMDKWISKFKINIDDFPNFKNKDLNLILDKIYSAEHISVESRKEVYQIQTDFYDYTSIIETENLLTFIDKKRKNPNNVVNMVYSQNKKDQLSVNQSVILLEKLGVFESDFFQSVSNVRQAEILSFLLGKDKKNIKTAIESLNKKPSELSDQFQKDQEKIKQLLDTF